MKSLFAKNVPEVLAIMFAHQGEAVHQSKIVEESGLRMIQVQRVLHRMQQEGLIEERKQGNMSYYLLVDSYPLLDELKSILYKTILITEPFKKALASQINKIDLAFIHGSFATGNEGSASDIDLFIVGDVSLKTLSKLLSPLSKNLQREVNPVIYTTHEFNNKVKEKDHFITSILRSKKMWLIGDSDDLEKMVK